jgi:membrane protease YdiL (CAAX protease family)
MEANEPLESSPMPSDPVGRPCRSGPQPILVAFLVLACLSLPFIYGLHAPLPAGLPQERAVVMPGATAQWVWAVLLMAGVSGTLFLLVGLAASPEARRRLAPWRVADRPLPSVGVEELLLFVLITKVLLQLVAVAMMGGQGAETTSLATQVVLSLGLQLPFYAVTILLVVRMARARGGPLGAAGIWPFWETPGVEPPRRVGRDVVLGLLSFVLVFWILIMLSYVNKLLLSHIDVPPDANPIVTALLKEPVDADRFWTYLALVVSVVVVAPIAEETLFRGLLYNLLCRHLDRLTAACAGALVFSFVHGVVADQWALFGLGLVLTWVYERTGRLLPAVVLHAANNAIALGFMFSMHASP